MIVLNMIFQSRNRKIAFQVGRSRRVRRKVTVDNLLTRYNAISNTGGGQGLAALPFLVMA